MSKLQKLTFSSLLISISLILSKIEISLFFPFGGSVTLFSFVPLIIISSKFNYRWGVFCGLILGILHLVTTNLKFQGLNILSVFVSTFLDYIISYMVIGLFSCFKYKLKNSKYSLYISTAYVFFFKFLIHTLSGIIVWGPIFKRSFINSVIYSIFYNSSYLAPEMLINLLGIYLTNKLLPDLFLLNKIKN